ncbi:MAG: porin [Cocleimonas sp.]
MKKDILIKSAIATAIAAVTTVTTIADTKLYGRFRAAVVCTDDGSNDDCGLENRSSRFGIKASNEISDGLTAFGRYEFGVNLDEGHLSNSEGTNRLAYVGLKGGFGEFSVGTRWSPMYNYVTSPVDPFQMLGGTNADNGYISSFRRSDTINYKNKFGAAGVHVQVQMDDKDAGNDAVDEFQIGAGFKAGSINLGLAYVDTTDKESVLGLHGGTKFGPIGVGVSYYTKDSDTAGADEDAILGLASYGMGGGKTINLSYGVNMPDSGNSDPSTIAAEYEHKLSKNFRWFAAVQNQDLDAAGTDDVLKYGAGMRLEF